MCSTGTPQLFYEANEVNEASKRSKPMIAKTGIRTKSETKPIASIATMHATVTATSTSDPPPVPPLTSEEKENTGSADHTPKTDSSPSQHSSTLTNNNSGVTASTKEAETGSNTPPDPSPSPPPTAEMVVMMHSMDINMQQRRDVGNVHCSNYPGEVCRSSCNYSLYYPTALDYSYAPQYHSPNYSHHPHLGCGCANCIHWNLQYSRPSMGVYTDGNTYAIPHQRHKEERKWVGPQNMKFQGNINNLEKIATQDSNIMKLVSREWKRDEGTKPKGDTAYCKDARKVEDLLLHLSSGDESHAIVVLCKILERNDSMRGHVVERLKCHRLDTLIVDGLALFIKENKNDDASTENQTAIEAVTTAALYNAGKRCKHGEIADRLVVPVHMAKACKQRALEMKGQEL